MEETTGGFLQPIQNREGVEIKAPKEMFDALTSLETIKNKSVFEPPPKFLYTELYAKYNNLPPEERDAKIMEEIKKAAPIPKNGTYLCNVNDVSLQMEVYWKEATQEESAGFYMRPMQGQEIKWNGQPIENVCQLTK